MLFNYKNGIDKKLYLDHLTDQENMDHLYDEIEKGDPTPNKKYVPWLAREYARGNIRSVEDILSELYPLLEKHHNQARSPRFPAELRDISKLTARAFSQGMEELEDNPEELVDRGEYRDVVETNEVRVVQPLDEKAACYYGQGTRWCTAATRGTNFFERYNKRGPLYIFLPKKPQYTGEKYQIHFDDPPQFMDQEDQPIPPEKLVARFPTLKFNFFAEHSDELEKLLVFMPKDTMLSLAQDIITLAYDIVSMEYPDSETVGDAWRYLKYAYYDEAYQWYMEFITKMRNVYNIEPTGFNMTTMVKRRVDYMSLNLDGFFSDVKDEEILYHLTEAIENDIEIKYDQDESQWSVGLNR
jgi:hypothetical protein